MLERVERPANIAHALRLAEALHAEVFFIGTSLIGVEADLDRFFARWRSVTSHTVTAFDEVVGMLPEQPAIVAIEVSPRSRPYTAWKWPRKQRTVVLVAGSESDGVSPRLLRRITAHVHIPMLGRGSCLNVGMALAIVAYHFTLVAPERSNPD